MSTALPILPDHTEVVPPKWIASSTGRLLWAFIGLTMNLFWPEEEPVSLICIGLNIAIDETYNRAHWLDFL